MPGEILNSSKMFLLSIDPTFDFGTYVITPLTYCHVLVESKSKKMRGVWVPATKI